MSNFEDLKARLKARREYEKKHPIKTFLRKLLWVWPFKTLPSKLEDLYYRIKYFIQRNRRGFSDYDFFQTDQYIAISLANILEFFVEHHHGYPDLETKDEYDAKIRRIAKAFKDYLTLDVDKGQEIAELERKVAEGLITREQEAVLEDEIDEKYRKRYAETYETMCELFKDGFFASLWD